MMNIKPIHSREDLTTALARVEQIWGAQPGSPEGDELEVLAILIEKYETQHYPIPRRTRWKRLNFAWNS